MPYKSSMRAVTLMTVVVLASSSRVAKAEFVRGVLTGQIAAIDESTETSAAVGDPVRFTYLLDAGAPDLMPDDSTAGAYQIASVNLSVGNDTIALAGPGDGTAVIVWAFAPIMDRYAVVARFPSALAGVSSPVFWGVLASWDQDPALLVDDALPTSLELGNFESAWFSLESQDTPGPQISGHIDSLDLRVVPDPNTAMLAVFGVLLLLRRER